MGERLPSRAFTAFSYSPLDGGFSLRLAYEGHTSVDGDWCSPVLVLRPADRGEDVLTDFRDDLVRHGHAPDLPHASPDWWRQPIFCGWGAQCSRAAALNGHLPEAPEPAGLPAAVDPAGERVDHAVTSAAAGLAREDVYGEFLARLDQHHLRPGTVVVGDRWQAAYGTAEPDLDHWPDLRSWIQRQHRVGRRVLLWWKVWDPAGLPAPGVHHRRSRASGRRRPGQPGVPGAPEQDRQLAAVPAGTRRGRLQDRFHPTRTQRDQPAPSGRPGVPGWPRCPPSRRGTASPPSRWPCPRTSTTTTWRACRVLPLGQSFRWQEYTVTVHEQPATPAMPRPTAWRWTGSR